MDRLFATLPYAVEHAPYGERFVQDCSQLANSRGSEPRGQSFGKQCLKLCRRKPCQRNGADVGNGMLADQLFVSARRSVT